MDGSSVRFYNLEDDICGTVNLTNPKVLIEKKESESA